MDDPDPDELKQSNLRLPRRALWALQELCHQVGATKLIKRTGQRKASLKILLRLIASGEVKLLRSYNVYELEPEKYYPFTTDGRKKESEKTIQQINGQALRAGDYGPPPQQEPREHEERRAPQQGEANDAQKADETLWG